MVVLHIYVLFVTTMSSSSSGNRKRAYREKLQCSICKKEVDSDYQKTHAKNQHPGESPQFTRVLLKGQGKISFSPKLPRSDGQSSVSDVSTKTDDFTTSCSENFISNAPAEHLQDTTEDSTVKVKLCDSTIMESSPDNHPLQHNDQQPEPTICLTTDSILNASSSEFSNGSMPSPSKLQS